VRARYGSNEAARRGSLSVDQRCQPGQHVAVDQGWGVYVEGVNSSLGRRIDHFPRLVKVEGVDQIDGRGLTSRPRRHGRVCDTQ
jgi:hypothetical protein